MRKKRNKPPGPRGSGSRPARDQIGEVHEMLGSAIDLFEIAEAHRRSGDQLQHSAYSQVGRYLNVAYALSGAESEFNALEALKRRRTGQAKAAEVKVRKTDAIVLKAWKALSKMPERCKMPERYRATRIAKTKGMRVATVRASIARLKAAGKI